MIILGTLDRVGTLYSVANSIGDEGEVTPALTRVGDIYLRRETPSARTMIVGARDADQVEDVIVMRWVDGFGPGFMIDVEGLRYRVVRADEIGRRIGWRVYLRLATAG